MTESGYDPAFLLAWCIYICLLVTIVALLDIGDWVRGRKPSRKDPFTIASYWLGMVTGGGIVAGLASIVVDRSGLSGVTYYLTQVAVWVAIVGSTVYIANKVANHMDRGGK